MLTQKIESIDGVILIKLANGYDLLASIDSGTIDRICQTGASLFAVKNPVGIGLSQDKNTGRVGLQFVPFAIGSDDEKPILLNLSSVVAFLSPEKDLVKSYKQAVSGIVVPTAAESAALNNSSGLKLVT